MHTLGGLVMKKMLLLGVTVFSLGLGACSNNQAEEESIAQVEASKALAVSESESKAAEASKKAEESSIAVEESKASEEAKKAVEEAAGIYNGIDFRALPAATQAMVLSTFVDSRSTVPDLQDELYYVNYSAEGNYIMVQVTSGAGTGHPYYLLELQDKQYVPLSSVAWMGNDGYETVDISTEPITLEALSAEYAASQEAYDALSASANDMGLTVAAYNDMWNEATAEYTYSDFKGYYLHFSENDPSRSDMIVGIADEVMHIGWWGSEYIEYEIVNASIDGNVLAMDYFVPDTDMYDGSEGTVYITLNEVDGQKSISFDSDPTNLYYAATYEETLSYDYSFEDYIY